VGDNGTGLSTLYDGTGTPSATVVAIPAAGGGTNGPVSGVAVNSVTTAFLLAAGKQSQFMFCSEDGVISGWNSTVDATHAKVLLDNSKNNAVYKGFAIGTTTAGPVLFVANFNSGKVEVYDATMTPIVNAGAFTNPAVPAGFAPFNIQVMNGKVFVVYAKPDAQKHDDVAGPGNGYVSVYDMSGNLLQSLIAGESPRQILSDDAIAALLQKEGIDIARRTVAKYREALRIPGSAQRKREKMPA